MKKEQLDQILKAIDGITYSDWGKLVHCIDLSFKREISKQNNTVLLTDLEEVASVCRDFNLGQSE